MSKADNKTDNVEAPDLGALTDEQIASMSPDQIEEQLKQAMEAQADAGNGDPANDASEPGKDQDDAQSAAAGEEEDNDSDVTGGAGAEFQSLDPHADEAGSTVADQSAEDSADDDTTNAADQGTGDDQSSAADSQADDESDSSDGTDWKAKYEELLAPFKASKRTVKVESPDDARRLMQMGYDYTNKMREMKPHLKILKTLEHNDLLDPEKVNFAIDLLKGNPEAMKKFLRDQSVDPMDIDLEDGTDYAPTDHSVSDAQLALDEVLDNIRETEQFPRTANVITKEWDKASQDVLMGNPALITVINDHMGLGYYDQIHDKLQYERSMGRLQGLSDLDAYRMVGDAMQANGEFTPRSAPGITPPAGTGQGHSQDSKGSAKPSNKARKRAASPTKGNASAGNAHASKNFLKDFTDEEMAKMSVGSL